MMTQDDILRGVVTPALVATLIVIAGWIVRGRGARAAAALAVGFGFAAGHLALFGWPRIPPLQSEHWLFYAAIAVALLGGLDALLTPFARQAQLEHAGLPAPNPLEYAPPALQQPITMSWSIWLFRFVVVLALSIELLWLLARHMLELEWTGWRGPVQIIAYAVVLTLVWSSADLLSRRIGEVSLNTMFTLLAAAAAVVIVFSGSQKMGQLGGLLAASMGAVAALSWIWVPAARAPGATMVFSALYVALIVATEVTTMSFRPLNGWLLLAAPVAGLAGLLAPQRKPLLRGLVAILAASIPAAVAVTLAFIEFRRSMADYAEYGY